MLMIDEATMLDRFQLEALDRTLRDFMGMPDQPFGGKIIILAGIVIFKYIFEVEKILFSWAKAPALYVTMSLTKQLELIDVTNRWRHETKVFFFQKIYFFKKHLLSF